MFSTLVLAASSLLPLGAPAPLPSALASDPVVQPVRLTTADKQTLSASYFPPSGKQTDRAPAVLLAHDQGASSEDLTELAVYLQKKGFGVLTLDLRGHGASANERLSWANADERGRSALWAFAAKDLVAGAAFLREQKSLHSTNLTVVGVGAGCSLAVRHALDDRNTRAAILIDPSPEDKSYDLLQGLSDLGGLQTLLVVSKDRRDAASRLEQAAEKANDGYDYVEMQVMRTERDDLLADKRLPNSCYTWLKDKVRD